MKSKRLVNLLIGSLFLAGLSITTALLPERVLAHIVCPIYIPWPVDSTEEGCPHPHIPDIFISFQICNERGNGGEMNFYLNGSQKSIGDGSCTNFSNYPGITVLSHDMWYTDGYQGVEYNLGNGGSYFFKEIPQGISLYSR
jgi:hypothetical protein